MRIDSVKTSTKLSSFWIEVNFMVCQRGVFVGVYFSDQPTQATYFFPELIQTLR